MTRATANRKMKMKATSVIKRAQRAVQRSRVNRPKKAPRKRLKLSKATPAPAVVPFKTLDNTVIMDPSLIARLPPELAYQAGVYAPGRVATPYVINAEPSNVRTGVCTGQVSVAKTTFLRPHMVLFFFPAAASAYPATPRSGIFRADVGDVTPITVGDLLTDTSIPISDVYGTTTNFADTLLHYATEYQVVVDTPEVNRSGEVYIGQLPLASFKSTVEITQLLDQSSRQISAKETNRYSTTVRIVNRNILFNTGTFSVGAVEQEVVSWMIFKNYSRNINTGEAAQYNAEIKCFSSFIYQPDGSSPILSGLVKPTVTSERMASPAETSAALQLSHITSSNEAARSGVVENLMKMAAGALKSIPGLSQVAKTVNGISSALVNVSGALMLQETGDEPKRLRDEYHWMRWFAGRNRTVFSGEYSQEIETLLDSLEENIDELLDQFQKEDEFAVKWQTYLASLDSKFEMHRKGSQVTYCVDGEYIAKTEVLSKWLQKMDYMADAIDPLTGRLEQPAPIDQSFQTMVSASNNVQQRNRSVITKGKVK